MNIKNRTRIVALLICFTLFFGGLSTFPFFQTGRVGARGETFVPKSIGIENSNFGEGSGEIPRTPSGWSGAPMNGVNGSSVISGSVELVPSDIGINHTEKYKLNETNILANISTPFSNPSRYEDADAWVLMIHNYGAESAYAYTSTEIAVGVNSYYRISVWVYTGDFADGKGAYVRLNDTEDARNDISFDNINTTGKYASYDGWGQYTFYVEGSAYKERTLTLSLQVGHAKSVPNTPTLANPATSIQTIQTTKGVAFFDRVEAEEISASMFFGAREGENTKLLRYKQKEISSNTAFANNDFESPLLNTWSPIANSGSSATAFAGIVATETDAFNALKSAYGFDVNPRSPQGGNYVLGIRNSASGAFGFQSNEITIQMHKYYLISVMVKTVDTQSSAVVKVLGENSKSADEFTETASLSTSSTSQEEEGAEDVAQDSAALYGWKQLSIYIRGSSLRDYNIYLQLCFGTDDGLSTGLAFFDNVMVYELTANDHSSHSDSGQLSITMDNESSTSIANGDFNLVGTYTEYVYPLTVQGWTSIEDAKVFAQTVDTQNVVSGIVNLEQNHFNANRPNYGYPVNPVNSTAYNGPNVLMIYSPSPTAFGYRSPDITIPANEARKITISLTTQNIAGSGVSLILKNGISTIASISEIKATGGFRTYDFYVQAAEQEAVLNLELWLGKAVNLQDSKTSSGYVFFDYVSVSELGEGVTFEEKQENHRRFAVAQGAVMDIGYTVYSFKNDYFDAFDLREESAIKTPYNWTLFADSAAINSRMIMGGIIHTTNNLSMTALNNSDFSNSGAAEGQEYALVLRNADRLSSYFESNNTQKLFADNYYKVVFKLKTTNISADQFGAWLKLDGLDLRIDRINTQTRADATEDNPYREYVFYIKTGADEQEFKFQIGLGSSTHSSFLTKGSVFVSSVETEMILADEFNRGIQDAVAYENEEDDASKPIDVAYVDFTELSEEVFEDDTPRDPIEWWAVPTILMIAALLIALIGIPAKSFFAKRAVRVRVDKGYDRNRTLGRMHLGENEASEDEGGDIFDEGEDGMASEDEAQAEGQNEAGVEDEGEAVGHEEENADAPNKDQGAEQGEKGEGSDIDSFSDK